jgi:CRP-like cAMP-binding protein
MTIAQGNTPNILIRAFAEQGFSSLEPLLERVPTERGQVIVAADAPIPHVYFPEGGVFSIMSKAVGTAPATEVGLFGREGVSGLPALLGATTTPFQTVVQVQQRSALRAEMEPFRALLDADPTMFAIILKFANVMMNQLAFSASSYAHDLMEARLARWLLMCHDRVEGDEIVLTHEFLASMLGSQRSSVTVTLHVLEGIGAIRSNRGVVIVRDRAKLEDLAGSAYGGPEAELDRLIGSSDF